MESRNRSFFSKLPVVINNYFGDPFFGNEETGQFGDTLAKLRQLRKECFEGVVGIITKSPLTASKVEKIKEASEGLNLVVLVSVSGLPVKVENVPHKKRIEAIRLLSEAGIQVIGYFRPIIYPLNSNPELLWRVVKEIHDAGAKCIVYSGMRGSEETTQMFQEAGIEIQPPEGKEWDLEHKLLPSYSKKAIEEACLEFRIPFFRKTSCGVSFVCGLERDYNCHYTKPAKYGCLECPMAEKCFGSYPVPSDSTLEFLRSFFGYPVEYIHEEVDENECENKSRCPFSCSNCPFTKRPRVHLKGRWSLGDLSVVRFITGVTATADEVEKTPVLSFRAPDGTPLEAVKTWFEWVKNSPKCYKCMYCILYTRQDLDFADERIGVSPMELGRQLEQTHGA